MTQLARARVPGTHVLCQVDGEGEEGKAADDDDHAIDDARNTSLRGASPPPPQRVRENLELRRKARAGRGAINTVAERAGQGDGGGGGGGEDCGGCGCDGSHAW